MSTTTPTTNKAKTIKREFEGIVVSTREDKTIHVRVDTIKTDSKYRKQYVTTKKYAVHDEANAAHVGDVVYFQECRPYSKTKRWYMTAIVKKSA